MKSRRLKKVLAPVFFIAFIAIITLVVMLLWNALLPAMFGITGINFWQAAGLLILARLFFGGIGRNPFGRFREDNHRFRRDFGNKNFREKLKSMTREERREYISKRMDKDYKNWDENFDEKDLSQTEN